MMGPVKYGILIEALKNIRDLDHFLLLKSGRGNDILTIVTVKRILYGSDVLIKFYTPLIHILLNELMADIRHLAVVLEEDFLDLTNPLGPVGGYRNTRAIKEHVTCECYLRRS